MKINKFLLFSFLSLFVLMPIKTHAFENTTEKEKLNSEDIEFAKKAVIQYYKNRDLGENNDLDSYFSKDVLKLINYKMKLAIIGDFSNHESNALNAFIYECNQWNDIFFVESEVEALNRLSNG